MATELKKAVTRKACILHYGKEYMVTLEPGDLITFRFKGERKSFTMNLAECFDRAMKQQAAHDLQEKKLMRSLR